MNADQQPDQLTQEERHVYSRLTRRGFVGVTAAATLGSLVGREPVRLSAAPRPSSHRDSNGSPR